MICLLFIFLFLNRFVEASHNFFHLMAFALDTVPNILIFTIFFLILSLILFSALVAKQLEKFNRNNEVSKIDEFENRRNKRFFK